MESKLKTYDFNNHYLYKEFSSLEEAFELLDFGPSKEELQTTKLQLLSMILFEYKTLRPNFKSLILAIEQNYSLGSFISLYKDIYRSYLTEEERENYTKMILGEHEKGAINVFIKEDEYKTRPVIYVISKKKGLVLKNNGKLTEEETLKLIESKQIVINYKTQYKEYDYRPHFFCAIDECLECDDDRVVEFTLKNYPFIYRDLRRSFSVKKVEEDKKIYKSLIDGSIEKLNITINKEQKKLKRYL